MEGVLLFLKNILSCASTPISLKSSIKRLTRSTFNWLTIYSQLRIYVHGHEIDVELVGVFNYTLIEHEVYLQLIEKSHFQRISYDIFHEPGEISKQKLHAGGVNAANLACTLARVSFSVVKFLILVAKFQ
jgi:hypothetical protein